MHILIANLMLLSDFVIPLPPRGWATGDSFVMPVPGGGWAWKDGFAAPLPGGGYGGYGFDRIPGYSPVSPWGLAPEPAMPGCDAPWQRPLDPWGGDTVTPYPYPRR